MMLYRCIPLLVYYITTHTFSYIFHKFPFFLLQIFHFWGKAKHSLHIPCKLLSSQVSYFLEAPPLAPVLITQKYSNSGVDDSHIEINIFPICYLNLLHNLKTASSNSWRAHNTWEHLPNTNPPQSGRIIGWVLIGEPTLESTEVK